MISTFLHIQIKRTWRAFRELGVFRMCVVGAFLGLFLYVIAYKILSEKTQQQQSTAWLLLIINIAALLGISQRRKDLGFLKQIFSKKYRYLLLGEYLSMSFLTIALFFFIHAYIHVSILLLMIGLISSDFIPQIKANKRHFIGTIIHPKNYFILAGIRQDGIYLAISWLVSWFLLFDPIFCLLTFLVYTFKIINFQSFAEEKLILFSFGGTTRAFIQKIIYLQFVFFSLSFLPFACVYLWIHTSFWPIFLYFSVMLYGLQLYAILTKYAFWRANKQCETLSMHLAICFAMLIIPFCVPVFVFMLLRNYKKAHNNLKEYFYA